jgi:conjugal transfer pilus assembly protein TraW
MLPGVAAAMTELEQVGAVYPVVEPDIRIEMKRNAAERLEKQKQEFQAKPYQPSDLQPLPRARQNRSFAVDMTYTLDRDLKDQNGNIIYPKGYTFNPLDYMGLSIGLVVIDGSDPDQVEWFKGSPYSSNHKTKLLLSGGYASSLSSELNRSVFYLDREVAERFLLTAVPCVVVQQDKHIQVTEFLIQEGK